MFYRFSCKNFTIGVCADQNGKIIYTAPLGQKFVGQDIKNLHKWMAKKFGKNYKTELLRDKD